jgi:hypothetical protein
VLRSIIRAQIRSGFGDRHANAFNDLRWARAFKVLFLVVPSLGAIRVGATQDMLALNIDLASVMQAGRWKTTAMPMRYGEDVQAGLGGMARTAKAQGRAK